MCVSIENIKQVKLTDSTIKDDILHNNYFLKEYNRNYMSQEHNSTILIKRRDIK